MEISDRIFENSLKGYCCSQVIIALCLEDLGKENEDLIDSMAAFCNGMGKGKICGTLAAAIAALHVADPVLAGESAQEEMMDWFEERFGGFDCCELIGDDPHKRLERCPKIILETYAKLREYIIKESE
jgi:hypothetical protein